MASPAPTTSAADSGVMTQRQVMQALSGLLLGMFVAILSSTIVSNALPHIVADLGGSQSSYTWVVTSTLLAMTASTPLWGKLSDLYDKKRLVQTALVIFVTGPSSPDSPTAPDSSSRCAPFRASARVAWSHCPRSSSPR